SSWVLLHGARAATSQEICESEAAFESPLVARAFEHGQSARRIARYTTQAMFVRHGNLDARFLEMMVASGAEQSERSSLILGNCEALRVHQAEVHACDGAARVTCMSKD